MNIDEWFKSLPFLPNSLDKVNGTYKGPYGEVFVYKNNLFHNPNGPANFVVENGKIYPTIWAINGEKIYCSDLTKEKCLSIKPGNLISTFPIYFQDRHKNRPHKLTLSKSSFLKKYLENTSNYPLLDGPEILLLCTRNFHAGTYSNPFFESITPARKETIHCYHMLNLLYKQKIYYYLVRHSEDHCTEKQINLW